MTKLDLQAKVLLTSLETAEDKEAAIREALKSFAADTLNLVQYLREKNVDQDAAREIVEQHGIDWHGKTKKFS